MTAPEGHHARATAQGLARNARHQDANDLAAAVTDAERRLDFLGATPQEQAAIIGRATSWAERTACPYPLALRNEVDLYVLQRDPEALDRLTRDAAAYLPDIIPPTWAEPDPYRRAAMLASGTAEAVTAVVGATVLRGVNRALGWVVDALRRHNEKGRP